MVGINPRCQICGNKDVFVQHFDFEDRLHYFACITCFNKINYDRTKLPSQVDIALIEAHLQRFRMGGTIEFPDLRDMISKKQELELSLLNWMLGQIAHPAFPSKEEIEFMFQNTEGKH